MEDVHYLVGLGYKHLAMIPIPELEWTKEQFEIMQRELRKISDYFIERYRKGNPLYIKHLDDAIKGIIKPQRRKPHCGSGRGYVLVKTDGSVYPCHRFGGDIDAESEQMWKLGTIFDGWSGTKREELLNFDCRKDIKADCQNCIAVHTCGTTCIAVSWACFKDIYTPHPNQCRFTQLFFTEAMRVHYILDSEENQAFIKKFHPERLRKPNSPNNQSRKPSPNGSSCTDSAKLNRNNGLVTSQKGHVLNKLPVMRSNIVLVALAEDYLSPCYSFSNVDKTSDGKLSLKQLNEIFSWAAEQKQVVPELFFMAGLSPLSLEISLALEDMAEHVITPLMSVEKQKSLNIPYSDRQIAVANSLIDYLLCRNELNGRILILHVNSEEIERLSESLGNNAGSLSRVLIRPKHLDRLSQDEIRRYKEELKKIAIHSLNIKKTDAAEIFNVLNVDLAAEMNGRFPYCLVDKGVMVYGTDGLLYACPACYDAKMHAIASLGEAEKIQTYLKEHKCSNTSHHFSCCFLNSKGGIENTHLQNIYDAEQAARMELLGEISRSNVLYDRFRNLLGSHLKNK
jgi:radical SAM protein with 4Fe4S-binding SPASM domain